ncbi:MAG: hypothetical protein IH606_11965 [Burkholderiales bacterium]|nr:hypothetical protein [Burkholderiales bacterium]
MLLLVQATVVAGVTVSVRVSPRTMVRSPPSIVTLTMVPLGAQRRG